MACSALEFQFATDSPLEEGGFEPLVPLTLNATNAGERDEKIAVTPLRRIGKPIARIVVDCAYRINSDDSEMRGDSVENKQVELVMSNRWFP